MADDFLKELLVQFDLALPKGRSPDRLGPGEQLRQSKPTRMCLKLINPHRRELTVQLFDNVEGILNDLLDLLSGFRWLSGMKNTAG